MRQSSAAGGGDYYGDRTQHLTVDPERPEEFLAAITAAAAREGRPVQAPSDSIVGRWAGDRIALVGDYDASGLWDESHAFGNVTEELVAAWNDFIELPDFHLEYNPCRRRDG